MQQIDTVVDQASYRSAINQSGDQYPDQNKYANRAQALFDPGCHCGLYRLVGDAKSRRVARYPDERDDQEAMQTDSEPQQADDNRNDDATEAEQGVQKTRLLWALHHFASGLGKAACQLKSSHLA